MCYCMSVGVCTHLSYTILYVCIFNLSGDLRDLHSFPTRRSSDLVVPALGARPAPRFPCLRHVVVLSDRADADRDRKSTRLNSSHTVISYAVFCLKKKNKNNYIY